MNHKIIESFELTADHAQSIVRRFAIVMCAINLLLPVAVLLYTQWIDQSYWRMFKAEGNFTAWWSSIQLLLIGILAYANYRARNLLVKLDLLPATKNAWVWLVFAAGFFLFAIDERFNFHEMLRDDVFEPLGMFTGSAYIISGDVGLYLFFLIGLMFTPLLLPELRRHPPSLSLFVAALVLTVPVVIIDSLKGSVMRQWPYWRFWDYPFEELGELWAQLLFLLAFLNVLYRWLGEWRRVGVKGPPVV